MEHNVSRIDATCCRLPIDLGFQPIAKPFVFGHRRSAHTWRRHYARAEFANHLFPQLRVIAHSRWIEVFECQIGSFCFVAEASYTILIKKCALSSSRSASWLLCRDRGPRLSEDQRGKRQCHTT